MVKLSDLSSRLERLLSKVVEFVHLPKLMSSWSMLTNAEDDENPENSTTCEAANWETSIW